MTSSARRLVVAAAAGALGGCGGGVHDLSVSGDPLLVVHGHVDPAALQRVNASARLFGALVWADLPGTNPVCLELDDPRIQPGCPDPYGVFQGIFDGAVEMPVMVGADGNFDIALFHLPKARASIGDDMTRIAYGALVVFEDDDDDGTFSVVLPPGGRGDRLNDQPRDGPPDTILGSTFWSLRADQQRLAFREGGFDRGSFFYPAASNDLDPTAPTFPDACVPPPGFSILVASPYGPAPSCSFPPIDTRMEVAPLQNAEGLALTCRSVQRGATIQLPQQDESPGPGAFCPAHADHPDRELMVVVLTRFCSRLNVWALKGCGADPFCDTPEWDLELVPDLVAPDMSLVAIARLAALLIAGPAAGAAPPTPPAPIVHVMDEKERVDLEQTDNVRLSLPTQGDVDAWASPGLRVQLGGAYGIVQGSGPALSWRSRIVVLRPSVRIDCYWGLGVALLYGTGPNGVRWSVTAEPTFYPWRQLAISAGVGYGGLSVSNPSATTGRLVGIERQVSREVTAGEQLNSCVGSALSTVLRAEYLFVAGALFASGPFVQANAQWTHCSESFGRTDTETGTPIVLTQWWQQQGATFGWWFAWR